ncbi:ATP-binding cassette domain-containing protein [Paenibacillus sp. P26]|nr:ATP-binding cassette domain-containing protein [Paenibacillus sp. P26]
MSAPLLELKEVRKYFGIGGNLSKGTVKAVDGISFSLFEGETLGIVGESGRGKSTVGRLVLRLLELTDGEILFNGASIGRWNERRLRPVRKDMQCVFQDPYASLNPRITVGKAIAEPLVIQGGLNWREALKRAERALETVGLSAQATGLYPHEFSGGQRRLDCHCACGCSKSEADCGGRAGIGAGCFDSGADREPARGASGEDQGILPLHFS